LVALIAGAARMIRAERNGQDARRHIVVAWTARVVAPSVSRPTERA